MIEYNKIETIYARDEHTKKVIPQFRNSDIEFLKDNIWQFTEKNRRNKYSCTLGWA